MGPHFPEENFTGLLPIIRKDVDSGMIWDHHETCSGKANPSRNRGITSRTQKHSVFRMNRAQDFCSGRV